MLDLPKLKVRGLSAAHYLLALRLAEMNFDVELVEGPASGFLRKTPLTQAQLHRIAGFLKLEWRPFLERIFATPVTQVSVNGRVRHTLLDSNRFWICEEDLQGLLRDEWLRRGHAVEESTTRFDPVQSTRMGLDHLTIHNGRGERFAAQIHVDGERQSRFHGKTYLFPQLKAFEQRLELRFIGQVRILAQAARVGTEVFVVAPQRAAIKDFESLLSDRKLSSKLPHFEFLEKLRSHWLAQASGSFQHQEETFDVAPRLRSVGTLICWGDSVGELPPLFNESLSLELRQVDRIVETFSRIAADPQIDLSKALPVLQVQLRHAYGETARQLGFWEFVFRDPIFGRGFTALLSLTPSVTRSWLQLPF